MPDALVERDGHTMVITMNRPQRYNALHRSDAHPHVRRHGRGVRRRRHPLRSSSPAPTATSARAPTCGRWPATPDDTDTEIDVPARIAEDPDLPFKGLLRHYRPTKPLIAAVEGVAIAGGTEILQGTDIRVAGESARFGVSEARWSLYPMARLGRAPAPPDPLHRTPPRSCSPASTSPPRRPRASGSIGHVVPDGQALDQGQGDRASRSTTTARSRSRRSCARCARPTA